MAKVTPNGVLWDCRHLRVGVINRSRMNDRDAPLLFNYKDRGEDRIKRGGNVFTCLLGNTGGKKEEHDGAKKKLTDCS